MKLIERAFLDYEILLAYCELDDGGVDVRFPVGSRIFSFPQRPDRLWGPPNLLSNAYRGFFPRGKAARA
jgi:hypothetical protein